MLQYETHVKSVKAVGSVPTNGQQIPLGWAFHSSIMQIAPRTALPFPKNTSTPTKKTCIIIGSEPNLISHNSKSGRLFTKHHTHVFGAHGFRIWCNNNLGALHILSNHISHKHICL
jgi:hypothetical protein